jgi:hypothetical protein
MKTKQVLTTLGAVAVIWHVLSLVKDAEQCKINMLRWRAAPTTSNLVKLLVAEGALIKDVGWLL